MANFLLTKFHFTCLVASAAVLLVPASLPTSAQQPPTPPTFREAQMPKTGWLGVSIEEVSEQKAQESKLPGVYGVLVMDVGADSPSAKAGLKTGDVITDYDGQRVQGVVE